MIVVVGDHGEGLGEHHEETHGFVLYDSTLHVPLIFRLPAKRSAGRTIDALVRTIDILPTDLEAANVHSSQGTKLQGASLAAYFRSEQQDARTLLAETDYPLRFGWAPLRAVRTEQLKYVE